MTTKLAKKWKPGDKVRVVSRTYGEAQATIKKAERAGYYLVDVAGQERVISERFISEE